MYTQSLANGFSFDLILVKGGIFFIGNSDHEIHVPDFYMAKYPVTQALWLAVMGGENPARFIGMNRLIERVPQFYCNVQSAVGSGTRDRRSCSRSERKRIEERGLLELTFCLKRE